MDPDYRLYLSDRLRAQQDGPMLEGLKLLHRKPVHLPSRGTDQPDRQRLALFEGFGGRLEDLRLVAYARRICPPPARSS